MTNIWAETYKEIRDPFFEMKDPYTSLHEEKKKKEEEDDDAGEDQEHKYEKKGKKSKDYDGDGEVEDEAHEYAGVKDRAIKKAMKMKEERELSSKKKHSEKIKEMASGKKNKIEINPSIKEEVEEWVDYLLSEGYDLSDYTWDELEEIYVTEARDGYGDDSKFNKPDDKIKRPGTDVPAPKKGGYGRISRSTPYGIGAHANRTASRVTTITGGDPGAPRAEKIPTTKKMVKKDGKWVKSEEVIAWVEDLIAEGYDLSDYTWEEMFDLYEEQMENDSSKRKAAQAQIRKELADVQLAKANAAAQKQTNESVIIYLENRYNL